MERKEDIGRMHTAGITIDFEYGELWRGLHRSNPLSFKKPYSWTVYKDRDLYMAEDWRGRIRYEDDDASEVVQSSLNGLTPDRTWKETVVLKGEFEITSTIEIPSYTVLVVEGKLKLGSGVNSPMLVNDDPTNGNSHIEIIGGIFDGNRDNQTEAYGGLLRFENVEKVKIENVYIHDTYDHAINFRTVHSYDVIVKNCVLEDIGVSGVVADGIRVSYIHRAVIESNVVNETTEAGIAVSGPSDEVIVKKNIIVNTNGLGIEVDTGGGERPVSDLVISSNIIILGGGTNQDGILLNNSVFDCIIKENRIKGAGRNGINVYNTCGRCVIEGNIVEECARNGIVLYYNTTNCTVRGNICRNNSQSDPGTYAGIALTGGGCTDNVIVGNRCFDDQASPTQGYGVYEGGTGSDYNLIACNILRGNSVSAVSTVGTNTLVTDNIT